MSFFPEASVAAQASQHHQNHPEARGRILDMHTIARVGMVGFALAINTGATADAHDTVANPTVDSIEQGAEFSRTEERKVERLIKRKIIQGKELRLYDGDMEWEVYNGNILEAGYTTRISVEEKVMQKNGKRSNRYFEVYPGTDKKSEIQVGIMSPEVRKITKPNNKDGLTGKTSSYAIKIKKGTTPVIQKIVPGTKNKIREVPVGKTTVRGSLYYVDRLSEGKRYVEQDKTVERLKEVSTIQEYKSVMQEFFDQYDMKVNITPDEVFQSTDMYTVEFLKDTDISVMQDFGFALADEFSKYPKEFIKAIGIKYIDIVKNMYDDGYKSSGRAHIPEGRIVFSLARNGDVNFNKETIHHEVGHHILYDIFEWYTKGVEAWTNLNFPGFQYEGGRGCRVNDSKCNIDLSAPWPKGVVSKYGATNIAEDQATLFAIIMCYRFSDLKLIAKRDPILGQKMDFLIKAISQKYPSFNEKYLARVNPVQSC